MMGAGKSSVGRALAELSEREFVDTDLLLQHRFGRPVHQIFELYGEEAFRCHETSILRSLEPGAFVLATGGGIVGREDNWVELRRLGTTIYLNASAETLIGRLEVSKKKRPLLMAEAWPDRVRNILEQRAQFYERADVMVVVDSDDVKDVAARVFRAIEEHEARP
ncbi:MAG: shikimate kinase [Fimbriimonadaceae bacterium]|jgi:shikimate kinase|nr:shikimate kinase [Fimbriimonadaceae bacterium]